MCQRASWQRRVYDAGQLPWLGSGNRTGGPQVSLSRLRLKGATWALEQPEQQQ